MSGSAPNSTPCILLLELPPSILCGIDLLSFTTTTQFKGIKNIPTGFHFIFTSETSSLSLRDGFWFHIPTSTSGSIPLPLVLEWSSSTSSLRPVSSSEAHTAQAAELWERHLSPYRQSASKDGDEAVSEIDWIGLMEFVTPSVLTNLTRNDEWNISSVSCMPEDQDDIPGLDRTETGFDERELGGLGIDLKRTWREGAVGRERTEGATDRSWALGDVFRRWDEGHPENEGAKWGSVILGQIQACFIMILTVANYSCLEEWKRCLELALTSKAAVRDRQDWYCRFLKLLRKQIERCEDVEGGLFDMTDDGGGLLKGWLRTFKRTLTQMFERDDQGTQVKAELEELEDKLRDMYGWELSDDFVRKGVMQLEDGETVEMDVVDMQGEDEDGEYAPVVVELDDAK